MINETPERIWAVVYPHHSGKGPPVINASASETNGREYIGKDVADAAVAAAYDVCALHHDRHADGYRRCSPHDAAAHEEHARRIRAMTPAEAVAAREARDNQARVEALREAAEAVEGARCNPWAMEVILALIPDQHKEDG